MSGRKENPDPTPIEVPLHLRRPFSLQEEMRRMIREEMSRAAVSKGAESFEEADDFDVDDDEELKSEYELDEGQIEFPWQEPARPEPPGKPPASSGSANGAVPDGAAGAPSSPPTEGSPK